MRRVSTVVGRSRARDELGRSARVSRERAVSQSKTEAKKIVKVRSEDYRRKHGQTERRTEATSKQRPYIRK
jgi:hypothetical protein